MQRHYQILDISPRATKEEVRKAFHRQIKIWHPDRYSDNPKLREKAEKKTRELIYAYESVMLHIAKPRVRARRVFPDSEDQIIRPHFSESFASDGGYGRRSPPRRDRRSAAMMPTAHSLKHLSNEVFSCILMFCRLPLLITQLLIQIAVSLRTALILLLAWSILIISLRSTDHSPSLAGRINNSLQYAKTEITRVFSKSLAQR